MRHAAFLLAPTFFFSAGIALSQDAAIAAAQQANQQAIQSMQQASQQAIDANQQLARTTPDALPYITRQPQISVKAGSYPGPVTLRLHSPTPHARIFYTTDGWTPTVASTPYTAPLTLAASTNLQAIAISPGYGSSRVTAAQYRIGAVSAPVTVRTASVPLVTPESLPAGTPVQLRFAQDITSETAYVGQPLELALAQDLIVDGYLLAPVGTSARAIVTEADHSRRVYQAGVLSFTLKSIRINGVDVELSGTRTLEGAQIKPARGLLFLVPVAGPFTVLKHGAPAEIRAGAELQGEVAKTSVIPIAPVTP